MCRWQTALIGKLAVWSLSHGALRSTYRFLVLRTFDQPIMLRSQVCSRSATLDERRASAKRTASQSSLRFQQPVSLRLAVGLAKLKIGSHEVATFGDAPQDMSASSMIFFLSPRVARASLMASSAS